MKWANPLAILYRYSGADEMNMILKNISLIGLAASLASCSAGAGTFYQPFGNPLPPGRVSSVGISVPPTQLPVATPQQGNRPSMAINASPDRVQETIIARARSRGTNVLGSNSTGVTLEVPLRASSQIVTEQCGPHQNNRTLRVYLETLSSGTGTSVTEDRFVIDDGARTCKLQLTQTDIDDANKALADLKQQSESRRVAVAPRRNDPQGGLAPVTPGRPVVPLR
jgi:hypothetical protein